MSGLRRVESGLLGNNMSSQVSVNAGKNATKLEYKMRADVKIKCERMCGQKKHVR